MVDLSIRDILTHPLTTASAVIATVGGILKVPVLHAVFLVAWNNAGALFAATSVSATTLAPELSFLPSEPLLVAAILTGILFVLTKLDTLYDALADRLGGDST